jgi:hypothetical protein
MHFVVKRLFAIILMAIPLDSYSVEAETPKQTRAEPITPSSGTTRITAKERLGEKWNDEQRVDNCKVPLEKRGNKPRPENCVHLPKD